MEDDDQERAVDAAGRAKAEVHRLHHEQRQHEQQQQRIVGHYHDDDDDDDHHHDHHDHHEASETPQKKKKKKKKTKTKQKIRKEQRKQEEKNEESRKNASGKGTAGEGGSMLPPSLPPATQGQLKIRLKQLRYLAIKQREELKVARQEVEEARQQQARDAGELAIMRRCWAAVDTAATEAVGAGQSGHDKVQLMRERLDEALDCMVVSKDLQRALGDKNVVKNTSGRDGHVKDACAQGEGGSSTTAAQDDAAAVSVQDMRALRSVLGEVATVVARPADGDHNIITSDGATAVNIKEIIEARMAGTVTLLASLRDASAGMKAPKTSDKAKRGATESAEAKLKAMFHVVCDRLDMYANELVQYRKRMANMQDTIEESALAVDAQKTEDAILRARIGDLEEELRAKQQPIMDSEEIEGLKRDVIRYKSDAMELKEVVDELMGANAELKATQATNDLPPLDRGSDGMEHAREGEYGRQQEGYPDEGHGMDQVVTPMQQQVDFLQSRVAVLEACLRGEYCARQEMEARWHGDMSKKCDEMVREQLMDLSKWEVKARILEKKDKARSSSQLLVQIHTLRELMEHQRVGRESIVQMDIEGARSIVAEQRTMVTRLRDLTAGIRSLLTIFCEKLTGVRPDFGRGRGTEGGSRDEKENDTLGDSKAGTGDDGGEQDGGKLGREFGHHVKLVLVFLLRCVRKGRIPQLSEAIVALGGLKGGAGVASDVVAIDGGPMSDDPDKAASATASVAKRANGNSGVGGGEDGRVKADQCTELADLKREVERMRKARNDLRTVVKVLRKEGAGKGLTKDTLETEKRIVELEDQLGDSIKRVGELEAKVEQLAHENAVMAENAAKTGRDDITNEEALQMNVEVANELHVHVERLAEAELKANDLERRVMETSAAKQIAEDGLLMTQAVVHTRGNEVIAMRDKLKAQAEESMRAKEALATLREEVKVLRESEADRIARVGEMQRSMIMVKAQLFRDTGAHGLYMRRRQELEWRREDMQRRIEEFVRRATDAEIDARRWRRQVDMWETEQRDKGGMDVVKLQEALNRAVYCDICTRTPKDAVLRGCGHVFCNGCITKQYTSRTRKCPTCNLDFAMEDIIDIVMQ